MLPCGKLACIRKPAAPAVKSVQYHPGNTVTGTKHAGKKAWMKLQPPADRFHQRLVESSGVGLASTQQG